jgi:hypothetical protein
LLKEVKPQGRRGVDLTSAAREGPHVPLVHEATASAAQRLRLDRRELAVPAGASFEQVVALMSAAMPDFMIVDDPLCAEPWMEAFLDHLVKVTVPALFIMPRMVRRGGLMSLSPDFAEGERVALGYVRAS